jgi:predicted nucleic acid-binding protein
VDAPLLARSYALMGQYRDLPMDFADATLVAVGEAIRLRRILALDAHFHAYRTRDGAGFEVIPGQ